MSALVMVPL